MATASVTISFDGQSMVLQDVPYEEELGTAGRLTIVEKNRINDAINRRLASEIEKLRKTNPSTALVMPDAVIVNFTETEYTPPSLCIMGWCASDGGKPIQRMGSAMWDEDLVGQLQDSLKPLLILPPQTSLAKPSKDKINSYLEGGPVTKEQLDALSDNYTPQARYARCAWEARRTDSQGAFADFYVRLLKAFPLPSEVENGIRKEALKAVDDTEKFQQGLIERFPYHEGLIKKVFSNSSGKTVQIIASSLNSSFPKESYASIIRAGTVQKWAQGKYDKVRDSSCGKDEHGDLLSCISMPEERQNFDWVNKQWMKLLSRNPAKKTELMFDAEQESLEKNPSQNQLVEESGWLQAALKVINTPELYKETFPERRSVDRSPSLNPVEIHAFTQSIEGRLGGGDSEDDENSGGGEKYNQAKEIVLNSLATYKSTYFLFEELFVTSG